MSSDETENEKIVQVKYLNKLKHLNEHYDEHLDEYLPEQLHRGDIVSTARLLGYADAMMATIATFLVIPIRNLKEKKLDQSLAEFLNETSSEILMFFLGFLIVCTIWEGINIKAMVVKRLDDMMVLAAILSMLATSVLPFSLALQGHFPKESAPVIATCVTLSLIEILDILKLIYAFGSPKLLHVAMHLCESKDFRMFRNVMIFQNVANLFIILAGGLLALWDYRASWFITALLILVPLIRKFLFWIRRRQGLSETERCQYWYYFTKGNISKERVEAFSDAAVAIIACVLILDITVEEFPLLDKVKHDGLNAVLKHMSSAFYTYFAAYITVSLLWYVNHTVLHLFHTINSVILCLQKIFLVFTCLCPLNSNMINKFLTSKNQDTKVAVRFSASAVFVASMCNVFMLAWAFHAREKIMYKWALASCFKLNIRQHLYIVLKVLTLPFWNLIMIFVSLGSADSIPNACYTCSGGIVVSFIILKFVFLNHMGKGLDKEKLDKKFRNLEMYDNEDMQKEDEDRNAGGGNEGENEGKMETLHSN